MAVNKSVIRVREDLGIKYKERFSFSENSSDGDSSELEKEELPSNLNFVGVINCKETRLYPNKIALPSKSPKSITGDSPSFKNVNIIKQYPPKVNKVTPKEPVPPPPSLKPCSKNIHFQQLNEDVTIIGRRLPPMPQLQKKPSDDDVYDVEYLDDEVEDATVTTNGLINTKSSSKNKKKNDNVIIVYQKRKRLSQREGNRGSDSDDGSIKPLVMPQVVKKQRRVLNDSYEAKHAGSSDIGGRKDMIYFKSEGEKEIINFNAFADMLKMVLPNKWSLVRMDGNVQLFRTDFSNQNIPKITLGVSLSSNLFQIHVGGRLLSSHHPIWQDVTEPMSFKGHIRFVFVLQLLALLHPYRVCLKSDQKDCDLLATPPLHYCSRCHPEATTPPTAPAKKETKVVSLTKPAAKQETTRTEKMPRDGGVDELFAAIKLKLKRHVAQLGLDVNKIEKMPETQDEVMASMGLQRRGSLDKTVRKSKRERKAISADLGSSGEREREEVGFLTTHWPAVTELFTENLSFGTYANLDREPLIRSYKRTASVLQQWHRLAETPFLSEITVSCPNADADGMSVVDLRTNLLNNVREINRLKRKFKTICPLFNKLLRNELEMKPRDADIKGLVDER